MSVAGSRSLSPSAGVVLWTVAGLVLYVLGSLASLFAIMVLDQTLLRVLGLTVDLGGASLSLRNSLWTILWGVLVVLVAIPVGRRLVGGLSFGLGAWLLFTLGLVLAGITDYLGQEFVRLKYTYFDTEYMGLAFFAAPAVLAIALAAWASLAVPRSQGLAPSIATITAVAALAASLLPSLPSAADGVRREGIPLAAVYLADVLFAGAASILVLGRLSSRPNPAEGRSGGG